MTFDSDKCMLGCLQRWSLNFGGLKDRFDCTLFICIYSMKGRIVWNKVCIHISLQDIAKIQTSTNHLSVNTGGPPAVATWSKADEEDGDSGHWAAWIKEIGAGGSHGWYQQEITKDSWGVKLVTEQHLFDMSYIVLYCCPDCPNGLNSVGWAI